MEKPSSPSDGSRTLWKSGLGATAGHSGSSDIFQAKPRYVSLTTILESE